MTDLVPREEIKSYFGCSKTTCMYSVYLEDFKQISECGLKDTLYRSVVGMHMCPYAPTVYAHRVMMHDGPDNRVN